jgi:hypothetical protein
MNGVAVFADHGADVLIFNVSFAVGFGFPHCAALGKDFKAVTITIIINDLVYILSFTFISHNEISSYYKVVVIRVPLQGQNATIDKVLWIGLNLLPQDGFRKAPTMALCF